MGYTHSLALPHAQVTRVRARVREDKDGWSEQKWERERERENSLSPPPKFTERSCSVKNSPVCPAARREVQCERARGSLFPECLSCFKILTFWLGEREGTEAPRGVCFTRVRVPYKNDSWRFPFCAWESERIFSFFSALVRASRFFSMFFFFFFQKANEKSSFKIFSARFTLG